MEGEALGCQPSTQSLPHSPGSQQGQGPKVKVVADKAHPARQADRKLADSQPRRHQCGVRQGPPAAVGQPP
jgi:hypothetical protein